MNKPKILIVEDEIITSRYLAEALERKGYRIADIAACGKDALETVGREKPDLILMDIVLDEVMDGIEVTRYIQKKYDIPVIYISAITDEKSFQKAKETGPYGYIVKPINEQELLFAIEIVLAKHELAKRVNESEEKYKALAESITDTFFALDKNLRFTLWNRASEELTGIPAQNALGKYIYDIFPMTEETRRAEKLFRRALKTSRPQYFTSEHHIGEKKYTFEISTYPLKDGVSVFVKDITERRRTDEALRESEERYRSLFEGAEDHIFVVNKDLQYCSANPSALKVGGFQLEDIVNKGPHEVFPEDGEFYHSKYRHVLQTGNTDRFERKLRLPDGFHWFSVILSPIRDKKGNVDRLTGISRDITSLKKAEEMLERREQEIRMIANNVPGLFSYVDADGCYRFVNERYEEWFGVSCEKIVGRHYRNVLGEAAYDLIKDHVEAALSGQRVRYEAEIPYRHGGTRWVIVDYVPDIDEEGNVDGFFALVTNITERKQIEEALKESKETYRLVTDNMLDLVAMCNTDGMFSFASPSYETVLGYSPEELIGKPIQTLVHPDDLQKVMNHIEKGLNSLEPVTVVCRMIHTDGHILWFETNGHAVHDERGNPVGALFNTRNITERKQVEDEKQESEMREREHLRDLEFLSRTAMEILELPSDGNLYRLIGEKLQEIVRNSVIIVNSYDERSNTLCCCDIRGLGGFIEKVVKLLGRSPVGMIVPLNIEEAWERLHIGKIMDGPAGLYDLSFGVIPKRIAHSLEKLLDIEKIYAIGFVSKGELLGTAIFILMKDTEGIPWDTVETFVHQAAIALQRKQAADALMESERKYRYLVENISDVIYMLDEKGIITYISPVVRSLYGYDPDDIIGKYFIEFVYEEDLDLIIERFKRWPRDVHISNEYRLVTRSGDVRWFRISEKTIYEEDILIGVQGILTDITDRKIYEEKLRESEEKARALLNAPHDGVFLMDINGTILDVNETVLRRFNRSRDEIIGMSGWDLLDGELLLSRRAHVQKVIESGNPEHFVDFRNGIWNDNMLYPIFDEDGKVKKIAIFGRDVTEQRILEKEMLNISENERKRIGQELHDGLGQLLTGIAYITEVLKDKLSEKGYPEISYVEKISTLIDDAIEQTRSLAHGLYPMISEPSGIIAALENMSLRVERVFGITCQVKRRGRVRVVDSAVATNLFSIAKEAVNNAIKHGNARNILMELTSNKSMITLTIHDDGLGCPEEKLTGNGMGLKIMRHRAEQIGAEFYGTPGEDGGFTITVTLRV
jgi:PAS domain S-box-containing protein